MNERIKLFILRQTIIMIVIIYGQITSGINGWWPLATIFCLCAFVNIAYTHKRLKQFEGGSNGED